LVSLPMTTDRVVAFYSGDLDDSGRTLDEILSWSDEELELVHDYIQWVFPTTQLSAVNPSAPLVTEDTIRMFGRSDALRGRLLRALDRMLAFYGLRRRVSDGDVHIEIDADRFAERSRMWLRRGDHNHLRLTRIMQSLSALGLTAEAAALQRCLLEDISEGPGRGRISDETHELWLSAVVPGTRRR
jgi:opioid growth factor receptor-like protein